MSLEYFQSHLSRQDLYDRIARAEAEIDAGKGVDARDSLRAGQGLLREIGGFPVFTHVVKSEFLSGTTLFSMLSSGQSWKFGVSFMNQVIGDQRLKGRISL